MHRRLDNKSFTDDEIKSLIKEYNIKFIKLQFVDINGQVKNMTIPSEHIQKALDNEIMLDGSSIKGFRSIETSDMFFHPDRNTFQLLPWRIREGVNSARLICDIYNADGTPFEGCPRCNLKRLMAEAKKLGFSMNIGPEAEFFLFEKEEDGHITTKTHDRAGYYDVG
ncbi:MAG: glutamine synthetase beta-grasp domain-containing protein, partial [Alphaproteobacteria bacterium]|nr:glutamine synthetase beta-grasp domain-containing protein [Alphaproteobacteria bacterium]